MAIARSDARDAYTKRLMVFFPVRNHHRNQPPPASTNLKTAVVTTDLSDDSDGKERLDWATYTLRVITPATHFRWDLFLDP